MSCNRHCPGNKDKRPDNILVMNIHDKSMQNQDYRQVVWTGCFMQMTVMCIPVCSDIGTEIHEDTDQIIRIEQGKGSVRMGHCPNELCFRRNVCEGDVIFVPAGTWHNVINTGGAPLKLSSIYTPPHHPRGAFQKTKADTERVDY